MKTYAITDIHGCANTFIELLNQIGLNKTDRLFLLGDYIDRGPKSIKTIDKIIELQTAGYRIECLTGNHEQMLLESIYNPLGADLWLNNGGIAVMNELRISNVSQIPQKYINFINGLKFYVETEDFVFVHAGLDLNLKNPFSDVDSLVWIRGWEDNENLYTFLRNKRVVHGHTPQLKSRIESRFSKFVDGSHPVLNIDNGCVFHKEGYNQLCCVDLTNYELFFQKNCD